MIHAINLFARAAYFLNDYAETYRSCFITNDGSKYDRQAISDMNEMFALSKRLNDLACTYVEQRGKQFTRQAAEQVGAILNHYGLTGTLWFTPSSNRLQLCGSAFTPSAEDVCVGVYTPPANVAALADDIEYVMAEKPE